MVGRRTACTKRFGGAVFLALAGGVLVCLFWPLASHACTSFVLSDGERVLLGSNFDNDFKPGMLYVNKRGVRKTGLDLNDQSSSARWTSKYGSVTVNTAPYQYAWAGINEAGLAISTMQLGKTAVPPPDDRPSLISAAWVQYVLDTCATIDEVIEAEKQMRLSYGVDHYLVCDDSGGCLVIEFIAGKPLLHRGEDLPIRALANAPYAQCIELMRATSRMPRNLSSESRMARLDRMARTYKSKGKDSGIDYAFNMLQEVSAPSTTWSLVFDLRERALVFRTFENQRSRRVNLRVLDFSCETPVRMLNMHAKLQGDITGQLEEYSHAAMAQHARRAIRFHKPDFGEDLIEQSITHVKSFECAKTED